MIRNVRLIPAIVISAFLMGACAVKAAPRVTTAQGKVEGKLISEGTVKAFLGLPYAAPPVGALRWKAPQPAASWKGVRDGTKFGARCPQWQVWSDYLFLDSGPSENCLYLNVYAPVAANDKSRLPVMFWIHGGGYTAGAGSEPRYTNSALPGQGVVLVTINYRMGVFGFLTSAELAKESGGAAGNYGLMDMVAALRWVQANIARFGGDAKRVTIFGESAGSFAVSTLMAAQPARGLFDKAIGESGAPFSDVLSIGALTPRIERDQAWMESLPVRSLAELRQMPAAQLVEEEKKKGVGWFAPVIDGHFLTEAVAETYAAGRQAPVPLLAGWNRDERAGTLSKGMTSEKWKAYAAEHYGKRADEFLAAFPGGSNEEAVRSADDFTTAEFIALGTWRWMEAHAKTSGAAVYGYRFELGAPASETHPEGKYAFHSDELEYVFGTLDVRRGTQWRPEDRQLSEQMTRYWANFARSGDPNSEGMADWPNYVKERLVLHLDSKIAAGPEHSRAKFEFLSAKEK